MNRVMFIGVVLWAASVETAWPLDQVFTKTAAPKPYYYGKIISMTSTAIGFEPQGGKGPGEIQANEVIRITFDDSPGYLLSAQDAMLHGNYEKALDSLEKDVAGDRRPEVVQEIAFCRAYSAAQLALSGAEDPNQAGKLMFDFIKNFASSFHYYKACELMGDLCVTVDKFDMANKYFSKLAEAPWADYKIRAQVALGRSYLAQGNAAVAGKAFDDALSNFAPGDLAEAQRTAARIGKARCMVLTGKNDQALRSLNEVIEQMEDKSPELNAAMAYNALGTALRKAGRPKEAIRAFLHVHLLYSAQPDLDAEAVANLATLFAADHKPNHAAEMRAILADKYANSRWAKGVK